MPVIHHRWFRGTSPAWLRVERKAACYGSTPREVMLLGATGSGKSLLAEMLHHNSGRQGDLVTCSLQGLPDSLAHGLLVGHRRGAFTDASRDFRGFIEQAHGGSLFLDELHRASSLVQSLLVDLGDRKPMRRLGDERATLLDVKLIYGTSAEPEELATSYGFAADLLYRFGYLVIRVPSLAERREDILPMAHHLLAVALLEEGKPYRARLTAGLERLLREYPWPGTARQLANVCVAVALHLDRDRPADLADLPDEFVRGTGPALLPLNDEERIDAALQRTAGNVAKAAQLLGVSRSGLYYRLKQRRRRTLGGVSNETTVSNQTCPTAHSA